MSDESSLRFLVRDISGNSFNDEINTSIARVGFQERGCNDVVEIEQHQHEIKQRQQDEEEEKVLLCKEEREQQTLTIVGSKREQEEKFERRQQQRRKKRRGEFCLEAEFADDSVAIIHLGDEGEELEAANTFAADQRGSHRKSMVNEVANKEKSNINCCCKDLHIRGQARVEMHCKSANMEEEERVSPSPSSSTTLRKSEATRRRGGGGEEEEAEEAEEKSQEVQRFWKRSNVDYSSLCSQTTTINCLSSHHHHKSNNNNDDDLHCNQIHGHSNERENCSKSSGGCCRHCCCPSRRNQPDLNVVNENNKMPNSLKSQRCLILAYFIAELVGTFLLVIIGDGTIAAYVLTKRPVDLFGACFAFGVGAMIASFASAKISGAQINPAASLAMALDGKLKWSLLPIYISAQYLGGFLAALVLFLNYSQAINALDGGKHSAFGETNSTGFIFATYPANYLTIWASLLDQIVGTAVLIFSITAVTDKSNCNLDNKHQPLVIAFVIAFVCLAFSPNCGAIFNPARDLPPRLITAIFNYPSVWSPLNGTYWILAGIVGPHIGAIIGLFAYKYTIGYALAKHKSFMQQQQQRNVAVSCNRRTMDNNNCDNFKNKCLCLHNERQH